MRVGCTQPHLAYASTELARAFCHHALSLFVVVATPVICMQAWDGITHTLPVTT